MKKFLDIIKKMNTFQMISIVGFVAVAVIVGMLFGGDTSSEKSLVAENGTSEEEVAGVYAQSTFIETVGTISIEGSQEQGEDLFVFADNTNGFSIESEKSFEETSGAEFRLPFYWDERFEGIEFATDVETFVVNKSFEEFVSGIRYGLNKSFINNNEVTGVQRTTGFENSFVHQAYLDLQNGTTLVFELRTQTQDFPEVLGEYIKTVELI